MAKKLQLDNTEILARLNAEIAATDTKLTQLKDMLKKANRIATLGEFRAMTKSLPDDTPLRATGCYGSESDVIELVIDDKTLVIETDISTG